MSALYAVTAFVVQAIAHPRRADAYPLHVVRIDVDGTRTERWIGR